MKTEIRRKNLQKFFSKRSVPPTEKSYISQLLSGKASFGEKAARRLEIDYGMGDGYLDSNAYLTSDVDDISSATSVALPEHIQAVIDLMFSVDERGMRKIRDAAEDALDKYRLQQSQLGVEIRPTPRPATAKSLPKKQPPQKPMHFEGSLQDFSGATLGKVAGRDIVETSNERKK
ncbi:hypothetical protein [Undibacterium sp. SXout20W]|uniref:hypothetical protein n=1 Tax=Undibacterium sp. SXout20W TaxID=3413051 RepID=UPI003BF0C251